ncbi:MAG: hypothetical protein KDM91_11865, partial [Verrucomicrobiae bacterium]|nr:hypothetical protein [Verrucomicrobiae bacterium]
VLLPLKAKALALEDADGGRFVFVTLDLIGVPKPLRVEVEKAAAARHGLAPERLLMNASHTHCGPMIRLYRPPGGSAADERASYLAVPDDQQELRVRQTREYHARLVQTIAGLIGEALNGLAPAEVGWSRARCGFSMNRRTPTDTGDFRNFPNPAGPVDQEVPVLHVRAPGKEGALKAVLFGYACHATTLGIQKLNGDWPGFAQHYFEEDHPGTVALFLNGCSGDQNPYPRRMEFYVERHGRGMATAIEAALETEALPVRGPLRAAIAWPEIPYATPPARAELEERAKSKDRYDAANGQLLLAVLDKAGKLPESYPVPVQVARFGDSLTLAALGGEATVDYSLRLKRELGEKSGGAPVWVAGYSNDVMCYIPSDRVLKEGGYEGKTSMRYARSTIHPGPWAAGIEERLVGTVHALFGGLE